MALSCWKINVLENKEARLQTRAGAAAQGDDVRDSTSYGVLLSQLLCFGRACYAQKTRKKSITPPDYCVSSNSIVL
ncbi:hypothetical protein BS639_20615 [Rouxiella silvae]|uniref:Uncharacterized protein n=1 Tax=Rouxiella silvae TaxID=1646373 RepID=A0ABX3TW59_9GAMM|nr:hypothetical protein ASE93_18545 [Serratia sp. Leaf50]ORJ19354.1 hypothetical protein BS639_20615 [Rouxiella silvae]